MESTVIMAALAIGIGSSLSHCAGMCGPLHLAVSRQTSHPLHMLIYHSGRLSGYTFLAALAGWLGQSLFHFQTSSLLPYTTMMMVVMYILFGLSLWMNGLHRFQNWMSKAFPARWLRAQNANPGSSSLYSMGLLNSLLPCPTVYAMLAVTMGASHVASAAIAGMLFGLSTSPVFVLLSHKIFKQKILTHLLFQRLMAVYFFGIAGLKIKMFLMGAGPACH